MGHRERDVKSDRRLGGNALDLHYAVKLCNRVSPKNPLMGQKQEKENKEIGHSNAIVVFRPKRMCCRGSKKKNAPFFLFFLSVRKTNK